MQCNTTVLAIVRVINNYSQNAVIRCSPLATPQNGNIFYCNAKNSGDPYDYGTTATYQCDSGYELTGGDTVRTCTGDGSSPVGQWNGTTPNCTGKLIVL